MMCGYNLLCDAPTDATRNGDSPRMTLLLRVVSSRQTRVYRERAAVYAACSVISGTYLLQLFNNQLASMHDIVVVQLTGTLVLTRRSR
eukprot:2859143-Pyramimonas_sp.AAC.3